MILFFLLGLICLLIIIGWILKQILKLQWDDTFISDFVYDSLIVVGKGIILLIAIYFVIVIISLIKNL